jgi:hypothetical protein
MTKQLLCKSCVKYKPADNCITRINAAGNKQVQCNDCNEKAKAANKARKAA